MSARRPRIIFIFPYHNNAYDTVRAAQRHADVTFLSPKTLAHSIYLKEGIDLKRVRATRWPLIGRIYGWQDLWQNTDSATHIVLKHLWLPENLVPLLVAWRRRAKVLVMLQTTSFLAVSRIMAYLLGIQLFSVVPTDTVPYLPAVIDPARFVVEPRSADKTLHLLCIAKYQRRKNIHVLLNAIALLIKQRPDTSLALRIVGMTVDQAYYEKLVQQVERMGLQELVTLETHTTNPQIQQYLAASDVLVLPAKQEPLGYVVLEAMAAGRAVVTTNEVGAAAYVANGSSGYVVPTGSAQKLAQALNQFIEQSSPRYQRITACGQAGRVLVDKHHSPNVFWRDFESLL